MAPPPHAPPRKASEELDRWLDQDGEKTLGTLIELFEEKSFALLFVLLLGVSALPLPTGGATHVFEIVAMLLALQLVVGREQIWLPERWRGLDLGGGRRRGFLDKLRGMIRRLERISRPRLTVLFDHRLTNVAFGLAVLGLSAAAFLAPPFTGLDTLPSLGVVVLSLAIVLEDFLLVVAGVAIGLVGIAVEIALGSAAVNGIGHLF
jgi:hypothetical protein